MNSWSPARHMCDANCCEPHVLSCQAIAAYITVLVPLLHSPICMLNDHTTELAPYHECLHNNSMCVRYLSRPKYWVQIRLHP